jgi:glycosyltransferase involved in cell wall biosynthesis
MHKRKNVKVSIIVPVYNAQKYIEECFNSIANQTYKNIEAVFVDDCSTDNSLKILQELKEQREKNDSIQYKIIKHEINRGVHISRNTGITYSLNNGADYICFIDNDDIIIPIAVEILLNCAKKYPDAQIIQGARLNFDEITWNKLFPSYMNETTWNFFYEHITFKCKTKEFEEILTDGEIIKYYLQNSFSSHNMFKDNVIPCGVWACLYKVDFIKKQNLHFAQDLPIKEDVFFRYLCFKYATKIIMEYTPIYIYRVRKDSYSHSESKLYLQIECSAICLEKMLLDIGDNKLSYDLAKWMIDWAKHWMLQISTEKEKTLVQRYLHILEQINKKIM